MRYEFAASVPVQQDRSVRRKKAVLKTAIICAVIVIILGVIVRNYAGFVMLLPVFLLSTSLKRTGGKFAYKEVFAVLEKKGTMYSLVIPNCYYRNQQEHTLRLDFPAHGAYNTVYRRTDGCMSFDFDGTVSIIAGSKAEKVSEGKNFHQELRTEEKSINDIEALFGLSFQRI